VKARSPVALYRLKSEGELTAARRRPRGERGRPGALVIATEENWTAPIAAAVFGYLDEQAFRFNERDGKDTDRFAKALRGAVRPRLTYNWLTAFIILIEPVSGACNARRSRDTASTHTSRPVPIDSTRTSRLRDLTRVLVRCSIVTRARLLRLPRAVCSRIVCK